MNHFTDLYIGPIATYSSATRDNDGLSSLQEELPSYDHAGPSRSHGRASEEQVHELTLKDSNEHPWLTVRFSSRAPSPKSLPVFFEEHKISGQVDLDIKQPESIKSVEVLIRGFVRTGHNEKDFLQISEPLWRTSFGDPRGPSRTKYTGKLKGEYSWPFSITLPREVPIEQKLAKDLKLNRIERLPPSLHGLGWNSVINYSLTVNIKKQGIFRSDSSVSTLIGYTPTTRPELPSAARRRAYRDNTPIPGPIFDPDGWQILRAIRVSGTLFKQREVTATYTLAIATPLAYTRGTVIPCYITVKSTDQQALELLASPSAPRIALSRQFSAREKVEPMERTDLAGLRNEAARQTLTKALWAHSERGTSEFRLMGELSVPLTCIPSFSFGEFKLEYYIDVHAPTPAGFQPSNERVLSSTPIQVVSAYAEGCHRPRAYITPAHDASRRVAQADTLAEQMAAASLRRVASSSQVNARPGTSSGVGPSSGSGIGVRFSSGTDALRQTQESQDVTRSASPSFPTGSRRGLSRRFSAL